MLMAMFQLMRVKREQKSVQYDLHKYTAKLKRVQNNIQNVQKMFQKKETQLTQMQSIWTSNAKQQISNQAGLTTTMQGNGFNMGSIFNGMSAFMMNAATQICNASGSKLSQADFQNMLTAQQNGQLVATEDGIDEKGNKKYKYGQFTQDQYSAFQAVMNGANQAQQMMSQYVQNMQQQAEEFIRNQVEAMKEAMDEQQDAMLLPLKEEETDLDSEKTYLDTVKLPQLNEEKQSYEALLKEEIKDSVPHFGLG